MKKGIKIALIVAGAMVLVGGVLCAIIGVGFATERLAWPHIGDTVMETHEQVYDLSADGTVRIHAMSDDITVGVSPDGQVHLSYMDTAFVQNVVTATETGLDLTQEVREQTKLPDIRKWVNLWNVETDITLLLPAAFRGELIVTVNTGDVAVEGVTAAMLALDNMTGTIRVKDVTCSGNVVLSASTGQIRLTDADVRGELTVTTTTGDVQLENVSADSVVRRGATGTTELAGVDAETVFVNATTGDVHLRQLHTGHADIVLTTGAVTGTFTDTSPDDVDITTLTGDVDVKFE